MFSGFISEYYNNDKSSRAFTLLLNMTARINRYFGGNLTNKQLRTVV